MNTNQDFDPFLGCPESDLLQENWLTEGTCIVNYKCPNCETIYPTEVSRRVPDEIMRSYAKNLLCSCEGEDGEHECIWGGTEPRKLGIMTKITFEKNGRKGIRTNFSDGKSSVRSQTKENAMNGKGHTSVLTKAAQEHANKEKHKVVVAREKQLGNELKKQSALRRKK